MNKKELGQLYHINREIEDIKERIAELQGDYIKATRLSHDDIKPSGVSDRVGELACRIADLQSLYDVKLKELYLKKAQIERFISSIEDAEIRLIFRLRHINCLEWQEIAAEVDKHRITVSKKYKKYIETLHNAT